MNTEILRNLSALAAMVCGVLIGYGSVRIEYLATLARVRSHRPGAMLCHYDFQWRMVLAVLAGMQIGLLIAFLFWRCYDRVQAANAAARGA
jgi:hypothetical protein